MQTHWYQLSTEVPQGVEWIKEDWTHIYSTTVLWEHKWACLR